MSEKHNRRLERAGVGSAITSSHSLATVNSTQSIVNKRVSQVGRSDPVDDDSSQESEEDEEEEGRTAIASKSAPAAVQPAAAASEHNRTKKKRGKKERQKEKDAQQQKIQSTTSMYENTLGQEATQPGSEHSQKKRKRRKVRSRQKVSSRRLLVHLNLSSSAHQNKRTFARIIVPTDPRMGDLYRLLLSRN